MNSEGQTVSYRRQFVAGPRPVEFVPSWSSHKVGQLYVTSHPELNVIKCSSRKAELLCLGYAFEPAQPHLSGEDVLGSLLNEGRSFEVLESRMVSLAGRWIIIISLEQEEEVRLYPDPGGLKSAYIFNKEGSETWVASQPALLAEVFRIKKSEDLIKRYYAMPNNYASSWPVDVTPYPDVRRLLPNHYVDIVRGNVKRFWPRSELRRYDLDHAAEIIRETLKGIIQCLISRGRTVVPLTAGYDSRVLFACFLEYRNAIEFCTMRDPLTGCADRYIPQRLGELFNIPVNLYMVEPCDASFWRALMINTDDMVRDKAMHWLYSIGIRYRNSFVVTGGMGEIARCLYYKDGEHPSPITAEYLARISWCADNAVAIQGFDAWLQRIPRRSTISALDLFYLENRVGNWMSLCSTAWDMVCEIIPAYNCRRIIEVALGVDVSYRKQPHLLMRRICEMASPQMLSVPFNMHWKDRLLETIGCYIPWRIRKQWKHSRMKFAGYKYYDE